MITTAAILLSSSLALAKSGTWTGDSRGIVSLSVGTGVQLENIFREERLAVPVNLRAAAWAVVTPNVHLGGFVGYRYEHGDYESTCPDHNIPGIPPNPTTPGGQWTSHSLMVGGSGRFGAAVSDSSWIGFNLDLGLVAYLDLALSDANDMRTLQNPSAYLFPSVVFLYLHPVGPVSIGIEAQLGIEVVVGGTYDGVRIECDQITSSFIFTYGPTAHIGLALGF